MDCLINVDPCARPGNLINLDCKLMTCFFVFCVFDCNISVKLIYSRVFLLKFLYTFPCMQI